MDTFDELRRNSAGYVETSRNGYQYAVYTALAPNRFEDFCLAARGYAAAPTAGTPVHRQ
jgi:hypothetical protein